MNEYLLNINPPALCNLASARQHQKSWPTIHWGAGGGWANNQTRGADSLPDRGADHPGLVAPRGGSFGRGGGRRGAYRPPLLPGVEVEGGEDGGRRGGIGGRGWHKRSSGWTTHWFSAWPDVNHSSQMFHRPRTRPLSAATWPRAPPAESQNSRRSGDVAACGKKCVSVLVGRSAWAKTD